MKDITSPKPDDEDNLGPESGHEDDLSSELDNELFGDSEELLGDSADLDLHRSFDMYAMPDHEAACFNSVEPPAARSDDLFTAASIEGVTLSDIERPEELQASEWTATTAGSCGDLPSDLFGDCFAGVEAGEAPLDDIFGWAFVDPVEHPEGLHGVNLATPSASEASESLQTGSSKEGLAVGQGTEVPHDTPSEEEIEAEIKRLKALLPPKKARPTPVQTPAIQPATEHDPVDARFEELLALCNIPIPLISPLNVDFTTETAQNYSPLVPTFTALSPMAPTRTSYQMPQVSRQQTSPQQQQTSPQQQQTPPQHQQGAQIELGGNTYSAVSNNGINEMSPPQYATSSPAASSYTNTSTSSPTPSKTPKRTPAKRAPAKRTPASASRVTKKKMQQRKTSTPASSPASNGRRRSMQELYDAQFITLTKEEKARLLLPLLQGIDPMTGRPTGQPGALGLASSLSAFNQGISNLNASPTMSMGSNIGAGNVMGMGMCNSAGLSMGNNGGMSLNNNDGMSMGNNVGTNMINAGMDMSNNGAMGRGNYMDLNTNSHESLNGGGCNMDRAAALGNHIDLNAFNMVQQAAAELNNNNYGMTRQNEALERAAMLRAAGRRR